jgi:hypothetical protein
MFDPVFGVDYFWGMFATLTYHTQCMIAIGSNINQFIFDKPNINPTTSWTYATDPLSPIYFRIAFFQFANNLFLRDMGICPSVWLFSRATWDN